MVGTTTTAGVAQTVYSTENAAIQFQNSNTGTGVNNGFYLGNSTDTTAFVWNYESAPLTFATANTERMRIDSSGRLLVGTTTAPSVGSFASAAKLVSQGNTTESAGGAVLSLQRGEAATAITSGEYLGNICFTDNAGKEFARIDGLADGTAGGVNGNPGRLVFLTENVGSDSGPVERMRIDSSGVVKINQSAYNTFRLQNPTSNGANMLIQNSTTGTSAGNGLFFGLGDNEASYVWNYHNEPIIWGTNNNERMRLSNAGDVSIGTSGNQTGSKLNVYGAIGSANTRFACTEHGKGASGTYSSIVFDFAVGGSPATVIFETRAYGYNQDAVDHMFGAYSSSHNKVIRDNNSSGMSVSVTFPNSGGVTHRVTISGSITHPVAAVKATAGGLASSIDLLSITFS